MSYKKAFIVLLLSSAFCVQAIAAETYEQPDLIFGSDTENTEDTQEVQEDLEPLDPQAGEEIFQRLLKKYDLQFSELLSTFVRTELFFGTAEQVEEAIDLMFFNIRKALDAGEPNKSEGHIIDLKNASAVTPVNNNVPKPLDSHVGQEILQRLLKKHELQFSEMLSASVERELFFGTAEEVEEMFDVMFANIRKAFDAGEPNQSQGNIIDLKKAIPAN